MPFVVAAVLGCGWSARAEVKLPHVFGDHMMLQRGQPVNVWGTAAPGAKVTLKLGGNSAEATAGPDGRWQGQLPALEQGEGLELVVAEQNTVTIKDILVGDVWLCSGQSNMEFKTGGMATVAKEEIDGANFPKIRLFRVAGPFTPYPQDDIAGAWVVCEPKSVPGITAVGYFFAREIHEKTKVPIGVLESAWGGTLIEPWVNPEGVKLVPELKPMQERLEKDRAAWLATVPKLADAAEQWAVAAREAAKAGTEVPPPPALPGPPGYNARDYWSNIYNGRIFPLVRFPIKGALWYQGESNGSEGGSYTDKMKALIGGWRAVWKQGDFPFYFVQLANFGNANDVPAGGDGWARIRCAQTDALKIPNTGMAVIVDIGESKDIHPKDKLNVGRRLARWALARDYGEKDLVPSGPLYKEMKIEGGAIRVSFDYVGAGLMVGKKATLEHKDEDWRAPAAEDAGGKLKRFAIAGEDKVWHWADAAIDGETVVVSSPEVKAPVAVRYAFSLNPQGANLYNKDGLPASPFRTDNW